jgi:hypothetical protein
MNYVDLSAEEQLLAQIIAAYCKQAGYALDVMRRTWLFNQVTSNGRPASVVIVSDNRQVRTYTVEYVEGHFERYFRVKGSEKRDDWRSVQFSDIFEGNDGGQD